MIIFRKFAIYLALLGILLAFILINKLNTPNPASYSVSEPAINPYEHTVAASGIIEAVDRNIAIGAPQSGLIADVFVHVWDHVLKGQPLFQIDDRELRAQLLVQEANIQVFQASLNRLRDQLARLESIEDVRAISLDELKTRQHDVIVAETQLAMAVAQRQQTLLLIDRLIVSAPKSGIILQSNIRPGEFISAGGVVPALILGNLDRLQVRVDIDEQNANNIASHLAATAFPKNNTTLAIPIFFERIEPYVVPKRSLTGASDERVDTRVLQVLYSFDKPTDFPLYVGQQVDVFIEKIQPLQKQDDSQLLASQEKDVTEEL